MKNKKLLLVATLLLISCSTSGLMYPINNATQPAAATATATATATTQPPTPQPTPEYCTVTAYVLNLREDAGTNASIIMWLDYATPLQINSKDGDWYDVTTPTGEHGHVHAGYCKKESTNERK